MINYLLLIYVFSICSVLSFIMAILGYRSLSGCTIFSPATTETQPDTVSAAASRRSSHVYDDISVVYTEKEKTKPGYVFNVECEDMGIDDDGYFESLE